MSATAALPAPSMQDFFPVEIVTRILGFLPTTDLVRVRTVSRALDAIIRESPELYRRMVVPFHRNWQHAARTIELVTQYARVLSSLELINARDDIVHGMLPACRGLKYLKISGWRTLSDHAFTRVYAHTAADPAGIDPYFPQLIHFELVDNGGYYSAIGSRTVMAVAQSSPNLEVAHIWCNAQLDPVATCALAALCPKLKRVSLSSFQLHADDHVAQFARAASKLEYLHVSHARHITDDAMVHLATHCSKLRVLAMHGAAHISDSGVLALATGCRQLTTVKFFDCSRVSLGIMDSLGFDSVLYTPEIIHKPCFKVNIGFGFHRSKPRLACVISEPPEIADVASVPHSPISSSITVLA